MKYGVKIDSRSHIFHTLNGGLDDTSIELIFDNNKTYAINNEYNTLPAILHGNEYSKV